MTKSIEEMIEVMQGYKVGKKIEQLTEGRTEWHEVLNPVWAWDKSDYRIAEEPKYRPYNDTDEMINDFCERFKIVRTSFGEPFIWLKQKPDNKLFLINAFDLDNDEIEINCAIFKLSYVFDNFTYKDGSPVGKKE